MQNLDQQIGALDTRIKDAPPGDVHAIDVLGWILLGQLLTYYHEDQHEPRIMIPVGPVSEQKDKSK